MPNLSKNIRSRIAVSGCMTKIKVFLSQSPKRKSAMQYNNLSWARTSRVKWDMRGSSVNGPAEKEWGLRSNLSTSSTLR